MRILFMGTPAFSVPILDALIAMHDVVGVVTQPDKPVGRKKTLTPSPVKKTALKQGIAVYQPTSIKNEYHFLMTLEMDIIVTAAYGQIIPVELLENPPLKAINVHASLLPKYRGGAPIHYALINGEKETGITIMKMVKKMDAGAILSQRSFPMNENDDVETIHQKCAILGRDLLLETLPKIEKNQLKPIEQEENQVTYAPTIQKDDEFISFDFDAMTVLHKIRGLYPWPIGYTLYEGKRIKLHKAKRSTLETNALPGTILSLGDRITVATKKGAIDLFTLQFEGKKAIDAHALNHGHHGLKINTRFGVKESREKND